MAFMPPVNFFNIFQEIYCYGYRAYINYELYKNPVNGDEAFAKLDVFPSPAR